MVSSAGSERDQSGRILVECKRVCCRLKLDCECSIPSLALRRSWSLEFLFFGLNVCLGGELKVILPPGVELYVCCKLAPRGANVSEL